MRMVNNHDAKTHLSRLVAQALVEAVTLLTVDTIVARYPGPIRLL